MSESFNVPGQFSKVFGYCSLTYIHTFKCLVLPLHLLFKMKFYKLYKVLLKMQSFQSFFFIFFFFFLIFITTGLLKMSCTINKEKGECKCQPFRVLICLKTESNYTSIFAILYPNKVAVGVFCYLYHENMKKQHDYFQICVQIFFTS